MDCFTPPPSSPAEVIVECEGSLYYLEYPPVLGWLVLALVVGLLVVLRRRYPGVTPILLGVLLVAVGFLALNVLVGILFPIEPS